MRVLWRRGKATARAVTDELNQTSAIAHSTVQTLLRKLEDKGLVAHELEARIFVFRPLVAEQEVTRSAAQDLLDRVFQGSLSGLVAHLLEDEEISREELDRLRDLIAERRVGR